MPKKNPKFNKRAGSNNYTGWIFFPKTMNAQYLIRKHRVDFDRKTISAHCAFFRYCRVVTKLQNKSKKKKLKQFSFRQIGRCKNFHRINLLNPSFFTLTSRIDVSILAPTGFVLRKKG